MPTTAKARANSSQVPLMGDRNPTAGAGPAASQDTQQQKLEAGAEQNSTLVLGRGVLATQAAPEPRHLKPTPVKYLG